MISDGRLKQTNGNLLITEAKRLLESAELESIHPRDWQTRGVVSPEDKRKCRVKKLNNQGHTLLLEGEAIECEAVKKNGQK